MGGAADSEDDEEYESDLSLSSDDSGSESDAYSPPASTSPVSARIPSLPGLTRLGPADDEPTSTADRPSSAAAQQPHSAPARHAGDVSPSDVPLSALSLSSRPTANGLGAHTAPRLNLSSAGATEMAVRSPGTGGRSNRSRGGRSSARAPALSLDLIAPAFGLDRETLRRSEANGAGPADVARQRAAAGLGVPQAALRIYELREVPPGAPLSEGTNRVAFAVADSSFALAAIEETMAENKRLMATNNHTSQALDTLQQLVKEQNQALAKLKVQASEQAANARRLQERSDTADRFASMLRQQLERSENLRMQGQRALAELKHEFEALTNELIAEGHPGMQQSPRLLTVPPTDGSGPTAALLAGREGERLTALLERFADENVLTRLEAVLEKAAGRK